MATGEPWSEEQKKRLGSEKTILDTYFPQAKWYDVKVSTGACRVVCPFKTVGGNKYEVTIYLVKGFPTTRPDMYLTYPKPCYTYDSRDLSTIGPSSAMHLLSSKDGCAQLCHCRPDHWSPKTTLYQILNKAAIWVQAFDFHKTTGKTMDKFLAEMK